MNARLLAANPETAFASRLAALGRQSMRYAIVSGLALACDVGIYAAGVKLSMDTSFPEGETAGMRFDLRQPKAFTLALRRPSWAGDGFNVKVNGAFVSPGGTECLSGTVPGWLRRPNRTTPIVNDRQMRSIWRRTAISRRSYFGAALQKELGTTAM